MNSTLDWFTILQCSAFVGTAVSAAVAATQLVRVRQQQALDSRRSRMQMSLQLVKDWSEKFTPSTKRSISLAKALATTDDGRFHDALRRMWRGREFTFPKNLIESGSNSEELVNCTQQRADEIRFEVIEILNSLERLCIAYMAKICDRQVLDQAFGSTMLSQEYVDTIKQLIGVIEGDEKMQSSLASKPIAARPNWPGINEYADYLRKS